MVVAHHLAFDSLVEDIDVRTGELSCADLTLEQKVQLGERSASGLRNTEVSVDDAEEADSSPEEAGIVAPVPSSRVQHVRRKDTADDTHDIVQIAAEHNGLDLQAAGGELSNERVSYRSYCQLVDQRPANHHRARGERCLVPVRLWYQTEEAHDEEHDAETAETAQVQCSASNAQCHEEPCAEHSCHVDAVLAHGERISLGRVQAGLFEEVGRVIRKGVAAQVLHGPYHADNLRSAQVSALKTVEVAGALGDLLFQCSRVDHHSNGLISIEVFLHGGQS